MKEAGGLKERLFRAAYNAKRQAILNGRKGIEVHLNQVPLLYVIWILVSIILRFHAII